MAALRISRRRSLNRGWLSRLASLTRPPARQEQVLHERRRRENKNDEDQDPEPPHAPHHPAAHHAVVDHGLIVQLLVRIDGRRARPEGEDHNRNTGRGAWRAREGEKVWEAGGGGR